LTHTFPDDFAAAISASEALLVGAGAVFVLAVLAGAAEDPEELEEAGALAAGAGVGAGAAEVSAVAVPAFLDLPDDFLEVEVSAAGADEEFSAVASDFLLFFFSVDVFDEAAADES
jgi:hypothetical protein